MESQRLPGKVLKKIGSHTLIELILKRVSKAKMPNKILVAIPKNIKNNILKEKIISYGYEVFAGSHKNVLSRYYNAARYLKSDIIIRVTSDCPFVDYELIDKMVEDFIKYKNNVDFISNVTPPTFPDGYDIEIMSFASLKSAYDSASDPLDKEHVTRFIKNSNKFKKLNFVNKTNLSNIRLTIDYKKDLDNVCLIYKKIKNNFFLLEDLIKLMNKNNKIKNLINYKRKINKTNTGINLSIKAKKIIPNVSMLMSKRPDNFLPGGWPTYYSKAKGCAIWDLDNKKFIDISTMGVGTNILGYANKIIDSQVIKNLRKGNMSTLNCTEDVILIDKLLKIHPGMKMGRLTRSGGEANAVSIRIARAYTASDKIAVCGYHGWHDWYLSANIANTSNLNNHLLPGLDPLGVPKNLKNLVFSFDYNNFDQLKKIVNKEKIKIIKMEVMRNIKPQNNFLKKIRDLCDQKKIILIFDECTSGFRETYGGIYKKFNITPDLLILGKALGNGYAINAVLGKKNIMENSEKCFISSTFWTERAGPTAAISTLTEMNKIKSWKIISKKGLYIKKKWKQLFRKHSLSVEISGLNSICSFTFKNNHLKYRTYITQEMLKIGYLCTTTVYLCIDHSDKIIDKYLHNLDKVLLDISNFENKKDDIDKKLLYPVCEPGFKRLN